MKEQELAAKIKREWKRIRTVPGPLSGEPYSIWQSPDGRYEIQIHDVDNDLVALHIVDTGEMVLNPRDVARAIILIRFKGVIAKLQGMDLFSKCWHDLRINCLHPDLRQVCCNNRWKCPEIAGVKNAQN